VPEINPSALQNFMDDEGLRLTDLSEKSTVSISFLSELRSGSKSEASEATIKKLADALNVRPRSLMAPPKDGSEAVSS